MVIGLYCAQKSSEDLPSLFGLLVAIPALFSYSFITQRIKDLNADMYLFADEFVVKLQGDEG